MTAKTKKPLIITVIAIAAAALIAAAVSFIYFPATVHLSSDVRCYDINGLQVPLSDSAFQNADYTDISYDLTLTKHWFLTTNIEGRVKLGGEWHDVADWNNVDGDYYCHLMGSRTDLLDMDLSAFVLDGDLNSVRIKYNDGKYEENRAGLWYGPASSAEELMDTMAKLGVDYRNYQA